MDALNTQRIAATVEGATSIPIYFFLIAEEKLCHSLTESKSSPLFSQDSSLSTSGRKIRIPTTAANMISIYFAPLNDSTDLAHGGMAKSVELNDLSELPIRLDVSCMRASTLCLC